MKRSKIVNLYSKIKKNPNIIEIKSVTIEDQKI